MATKHYILEEEILTDASSYYGPFDESELTERLNDAYADLLTGAKSNIDAVELTDEEAAKIYINPREFWMSQLATTDYIQETRSA